MHANISSNPCPVKATSSEDCALHWRKFHSWCTDTHLCHKFICLWPFRLLDTFPLWKILKEMGIPDHLKCLLRNLYASQESAVRTVHGTTDWFQIRKGVCQCCILSPSLFNLYAEYIMKMPVWMRHKLKSRLPGEISVTSDMQMTPPLWQKAKNKRTSWWKWKRRVKKLA